MAAIKEKKFNCSNPTRSNLKCSKVVLRLVERAIEED
jgi:hypothetical protein